MTIDFYFHLIRYKNSFGARRTLVWTRLSFNAYSCFFFLSGECQNVPNNARKLYDHSCFNRGTGCSWIPSVAVLKEPHKNASISFSGKDGTVTSLPPNLCKANNQEVGERNWIHRHKNTQNIIQKTGVFLGFIGICSYSGSLVNPFWLYTRHQDGSRTSKHTPCFL